MTSVNSTEMTTRKYMPILKPFVQTWHAFAAPLPYPSEHTSHSFIAAGGVNQAVGPDRKSEHVNGTARTTQNNFPRRATYILQDVGDCAMLGRRTAIMNALQPNIAAPTCRDPSCGRDPSCSERTKGSNCFFPFPEASWFGITISSNC